MKTRAKGYLDRIVWGDVFPKSKISMIDNGRVKKIRIEGAKKLLLCLEKEVKILLPEEILYCYGFSLACISYTSGALEVLGDVTEMRFEKRGTGKEEKR